MDAYIAKRETGRPGYHQSRSMTQGDWHGFRQEHGAVHLVAAGLRHPAYRRSQSGSEASGRAPIGTGRAEHMATPAHYPIIRRNVDRNHRAIVFDGIIFWSKARKASISS